MKFISAIVIALALLPASYGALLRHNDRKETDNDRFRTTHLDQTTNRPKFVVGTFGTIQHQDDDEMLKTEAAALLPQALARHDSFDFSGTEKLVPADHAKVHRDANGDAHIRFKEVVHGMPVEGAALVAHLKNNNIVAMNGEVVNAEKIPSTPRLDADTALSLATTQASLKGKWLHEPQLTVVYGDDGKGYLAWKNLLAYKPKDGGIPQKDLIFASAESGDLVARHPQVFGALSIKTTDCETRTWSCRTVSTSTDPINTGDAAVDAAHNFSLLTYRFFYENYGRDSMDDAGMQLISNVHYGVDYNNAYFDGTQLTYGDGDGETFIPLCLDLDVVAHEITHGVTQFTSGLIYRDESGAVNEAISDIFGATIERWAGASITDTFLIGEDIYTPRIEGDALRSMADPQAYGGYDWWPTRYQGPDDNGGVHMNSGIVNLAFNLLVAGGSHPRGASNIVVPALDNDFDLSIMEAARIFYEANTACLTPSSDMATLRYCTAEVYGGAHADKIRAAWDAVGVTVQEPITLQNGIPLRGQAAETGVKQPYTLSNVAAGEKVTCELQGNNGDADLYVRLGAPAIPDPNSPDNACSSTSADSNEECTTDPADTETTAFVTVHAWTGYTGLSIICSTDGAPDNNKLQSGQPLVDLSASAGDVLEFVLDNVGAGDVVGCGLFGNSGDADLYVRVNGVAVPDPGSTFNNCASHSPSSFEQCATRIGSDNSWVSMVVHAYSNIQDLNLICFKLN